MPISTSDGKQYDNSFDFWHAQLFGEQPTEQSKGENRLFLVRHGDTRCNDDGEVHGWVDQPLNQDGIDQAHKAAESLKDKNITRIVSSDLPRAKQTANILAKQLGIDDISFDPNLRTWDAGDFDYTTKHKEFEKYTQPAQFSSKQFFPQRPEGPVTQWMENTPQRMGQQLKDQALDLVDQALHRPKEFVTNIVGTGELGIIKNPITWSAIDKNAQELGNLLKNLGKHIDIHEAKVDDLKDILIENIRDEKPELSEESATSVLNDMVDKNTEYDMPGHITDDVQRYKELRNTLDKLKHTKTDEEWQKYGISHFDEYKGVDPEDINPYNIARQASKGELDPSLKGNPFAPVAWAIDGKTTTVIPTLDGKPTGMEPSVYQHGLHYEGEPEWLYNLEK